MYKGSTKDKVSVDLETIKQLMEAMEEHEDIQQVHANFDISDEDMAQAAEE